MILLQRGESPASPFSIPDNPNHLERMRVDAGASRHCLGSIAYRACGLALGFGVFNSYQLAAAERMMTLGFNIQAALFLPTGNAFDV